MQEKNKVRPRSLGFGVSDRQPDFVEMRLAPRISLMDSDLPTWDRLGVWDRQIA